MRIPLVAASETGRAQIGNPMVLAFGIVVCRSVLSGGLRLSPLERGAEEGESPVDLRPCRIMRDCR